MRRRVNAEIQLGLLWVVVAQVLQQQGSESRSSASTDAVEDEESLQRLALVDGVADRVERALEELLADSVVAARIVVGSVLFAVDKRVWVVQLALSVRKELRER
jgi:hypothetical protein